LTNLVLYAILCVVDKKSLLSKREEGKDMSKGYVSSVKFNMSMKEMIDNTELEEYQKEVEQEYEEDKSAGRLRLIKQRKRLLHI